ncbi:MAG: sigma-54 dependent transcriptional regulator [Opitutales bacterium]
MEIDGELMANFAGREILLLEDDALLSKRLNASLEFMGAEVTTCSNLEEARSALENLHFDFALLDLNLPDGLSLDLLRDGSIPENVVTILMTADGGIRSAVEAIRLGAADYLAKPFDFAELPLVFRNAENTQRRERRREHARENARKEHEGLFFEGSFAEDLAQLRKIIEADVRLGQRLPPVLIEGETGSGKSAYARWLHENGPRADAPFVEINCSTIPENLAESELFGHEKGAFTDAKGARIGLFEAAHGGTLFLDETASLSLAVQAKLLTALEERRFRRVGGNKDMTSDARVITAANRGLRDMVTAGTFREDLYHRLDLLRVQIAPLRERGDGILGLAQRLLESICKRYKVKAAQLSEAGQSRLAQHSWPGNVRELAHELERAVVMNGTESPLDFPNLPGVATSSQGMDAGADWLSAGWTFPEEGFDLEDAILRLIRKAIAQADGNVTAAARILGVPRDYLRYRLGKSKEFD